MFALQCIEMLTDFDQYRREKCSGYTRPKSWTAWHTWCEKRYNEIALNWLSGSEPDSSDNEDLRQIAQSCLHEGGRAVLSARGLCEVWLREHYGDGEECEVVADPEDAEKPAGTKFAAAPSMTVTPNPTGDMIRIQLTEIEVTKIPLQVQVLTLDGRKMYAGELSAESAELNIPVKNWPNGIYIVRVGNLWSKSFVVQHK